MAVSAVFTNFGTSNLQGSRFLLEAIGTFIIGLFSWVLMPPGPCQTKSWFRGKNGWFNEREEYIMVNRLLRDDPSKGDMNNRYAAPEIPNMRTD